MKAEALLDHAGFVRAPAGSSVEGVSVTVRPDGYFANPECVSDAEGRVEFRMLRVQEFDPRGPRGPDRRLRFVATAPWIGRLNLAWIGHAEPPGGPLVALIVRKSLTLTLQLVDDAGKPIAGTELSLTGQKLTTDESGRVQCELPLTPGSLYVGVPGYLPKALPIHEPK